MVLKLKPHTKYSSRREITFDVLDSRMWLVQLVATALVEADAYTCPRIQLAFWSKTQAEENWNGLIQAVPNEPVQRCLSKARRMG